jgi:hypothetical protein
MSEFEFDKALFLLLFVSLYVLILMIQYRTKFCMKCHLVYADDILLIAHSVNGLQKMIAVIENYFNWLHLSLTNCAKSCCMSIGKRFNCHVPLSSLEQVREVNPMRFVKPCIHEAIVTATVASCIRGIT